MNSLPLTLGGLLAVTGAIVALVAVRKQPVNVASVLAELNGDTMQLDGYTEKLMTHSLAARLLGPAGRRVGGMIRGFLPTNYLSKLERTLMLAGIENVGPEEFVALQTIAAGLGALFALAISTLLGWGTVGTLRALPVFAGFGAVVPVEWRQRKRNERRMTMRRDLPDVLDLLAISVEAGVGLEGAIEVVCRHFDTPLAQELARLLREMELGVPRRTALKNMRRRVDLPEIGQFILALIQADALGMPLGKVLRVQATQMRAKRRQWARERAAKLPVKIIFPLLGFILPALFVVVLGPAVQSISHNVLHHAR